jgi:diaminopimelate epimerase
MRLPFVKMHGLGNDFVVLDQRARDYALDAATYRTLADRRRGIGCDQILVLDPPTRTAAAVRYRVVNADGTPAEHCGNGVRCVAAYLARDGQAPHGEVAVEIGDEVFALRQTANGDVRVDMGRPQFAPAAIPLAVPSMAARYTLHHAGHDYEFGAVSLGNPHAVFEVEGVEEAPLESLGPALQAHPLFPARVNVGFMQVTSSAHIRLRVFERGVGETAACGTGACAAVAIGRRWGRLGSRVDVDLRGGRLTIEWSGQVDDSLWMTGPATFVFEGTIDL